MPNTVSENFYLIEKNEPFLLKRFEVSCPVFEVARRNLRSIVVQLHESQEPAGIEAAEYLRVALSRWLTMPIPFEEGLSNVIRRALGPKDRVEDAWGDGVAECAALAGAALDDLENIGNRLNECVNNILNTEFEKGGKVKIFCHKSANSVFNQLIWGCDRIYLEETVYMNSLAQYKNSEIFDVLVKFGPLRDSGWGGIPEGVLTAPKYKKLVQFVWAGSQDQPGFGEDPVPRWNREGETAEPKDDVVSYGPIRWRRATSKEDYGEREGKAGEAAYVDDLEALAEVARPRRTGDERQALLAILEDDQGVLLFPGSELLVVSTTNHEGGIDATKIRARELQENMFIVVPEFQSKDAAGPNVANSQYSVRWKKVLNQEVVRDKTGLIKRLENAGVHLSNWDISLKYWEKPPTTVVHAPRKKEHFETLISALRLDEDTVTESGRRRRFVEIAWDEIRKSRGEAIQSGAQSRDSEEQVAMEEIRERIEEVKALMDESNGFYLVSAYADRSVDRMQFHRVLAIEDGFVASEEHIKTIQNFDEVEKWRG